MEIDFSTYSLEELYEVKNNIDATTYPDRYNEILKQISIKKAKETKEKPSDKFHGRSIDFMEDPLAKATQWTPLAKGGANFTTHIMDHSHPTKIRFKPSIGLYLFTLAFIGGSIYMLVAFENQLLTYGKWPNSLEDYLQTFGPFVFVGFTILLIVKLMETIVFDKKRGIYWKGISKPSIRNRSSGSSKFTRLHRIHAIQIIAELCDGDDSSDYYSYELNLILKNAKRLQVIDHGNLQNIRSDGYELARFLGVPIWEKIEQNKRSFLSKLLRIKF